MLQESSRAAVLDTTVILRSYLLDTILRAAERGLFKVHWSPKILEEFERNFVKIRLKKHTIAGRTASLEELEELEEQYIEQAQSKIRAMNEAFPSAIVTGSEQLEVLMLNDPKDRHVLAAAVKSKCDLIVTDNIRHFPESALAPYGIETQRPDDFLTELFDEYAGTMVSIIQEQIQSYTQPAMDLSELLRRLQGAVPTFAARVRQALDDRTA
jgi:predicted nucleic acid-binding protein